MSFIKVKILLGTLVSLVLMYIFFFSGNFSILNYFFDLFEKDPEMYPMLDPAQTNSDGDSLFHLVAKAKYSATTQKATELLCDKKVNASVLNKEGKLPKDYLNSKNDRRLQVCVLTCIEIFQKKLRINFFHSFSWIIKTLTKLPIITGTSIFSVTVLQVGICWRSSET